ncbi:MAG: sulfurtransferase TusE [Gammaproteobacteria bacterium]|nr:MAG: sulfurtransferase TusE [Gammaproteobacteria bacterium]
MAYEINGKTIEITGSGYLVNQEDWDKSVAEVIAQQEGITLSQDHWDVMEFLRDQYFNNNGALPNNRQIMKAMQQKWPDKKVDNKILFDLFPGNPSKQAGKIAGLPESMRKGGY